MLSLFVTYRNLSAFQKGATLGSPAYHALFDKAKLNAWETILIHGASGSVGLLAVQLAKRAGAKVIGTASSLNGINQVKQAGADLVLNHHDPSYLDNVQNVDLVIEMLANVNLIKDIEILKQFGRIVIIGNPGSLDFNPQLIINKDITLTGMSLWNVPDKQYQHNLDAIATLLDQKKLIPKVGTVLPLAEAAKAQQQTLAHSLGKVVLKIFNKE